MRGKYGAATRSDNALLWLRGESGLRDVRHGDGGAGFGNPDQKRSVRIIGG